MARGSVLEVLENIFCPKKAALDMECHRQLFLPHQRTCYKDSPTWVEIMPPIPAPKHTLSRSIVQRGPQWDRGKCVWWGGLVRVEICSKKKNQKQPAYSLPFLNNATPAAAARRELSGLSVIPSPTRGNTTPKKPQKCAFTPHPDSSYATLALPADPPLTAPDSAAGPPASRGESEDNISQCL